MNANTFPLARPVAAAVTVVLLFGAGVATAAPGQAPSTPPAPEIALTQIAEVPAPVDLAWRAQDPALYVVGQDGVVVRLDGDTNPVVLDVSDLTENQGEQGLLGLAFAPDGSKGYVNFTDNNGDTNVVELTVGSDGAFDRESMRTVLFVEQPYANHNGGGLVFGPDGLLYIGLGDGGAGGDPERRAQNLSELLGKMLRIDPSTPSGDLGYTIPADNPFVGTDGARGEIWSVGLRNPWRYSFDPETGDLRIADVGQGSLEEISVASAANGVDAGRGSNFGWSAFEGSQPYNDDVDVTNHTPPMFEYSHSGGRCSISGGVRARGDGAGELAGWYVFADYCSGELMAISFSGSGSEVTASPDESVLATATSITAVVAGPDGTIYVLSHVGPVYRVDPAS
jgi:glucose/arabinose dehydrogenase